MQAGLLISEVLWKDVAFAQDLGVPKLTGCSSFHHTYKYVLVLSPSSKIRLLTCPLALPARFQEGHVPPPSPHICQNVNMKGRCRPVLTGPAPPLHGNMQQRRGAAGRWSGPGTETQPLQLPWQSLNTPWNVLCLKQNMFCPPTKLARCQPQDPVAYVPVCLKILGKFFWWPFPVPEHIASKNMWPGKRPTGSQAPFLKNYLQDHLLLRIESRPDTALSALCLPSRWMHMVVIQTRIGFTPFHQRRHFY